MIFKTIDKINKNSRKCKKQFYKAPTPETSNKKFLLRERYFAVLLFKLYYTGDFLLRRCFVIGDIFFRRCFVKETLCV
jgi:hypothetical protein